MRAVELWVGATDDTPVPPRVRLRVFEAKLGRCHACGRKILSGERWTCEHLIAICNGGRNAEINLGLTCCNCLPIKNAADAAEKSKIATLRKKHILPKPLSTWGAGKGSKFKKKLSGEVVPR